MKKVILKMEAEARYSFDKRGHSHHYIVLSLPVLTTTTVTPSASPIKSHVLLDFNASSTSEPSALGLFSYNLRIQSWAINKTSQNTQDTLKLYHFSGITQLSWLCLFLLPFQHVSFFSLNLSSQSLVIHSIVRT